MPRILLIIHLVPLVLIELFVYKKYGKNRLKWWQTWTKEASGCGRATWAHRAAPPSPTWAPLGPTKCHLGTLPHQWSVGATPEAMSSVDSSRFAPMDEMELTQIHWPPSYTWRLQSTLELPYRPSFGMCWLHNRHWEPANTIGCKGGASKGRSTPLCHRSVPSCLHRPPCYLQIPPMPLYTINRGCGARWKDAPFISKLSKLLLAF